MIRLLYFSQAMSAMSDAQMRDILQWSRLNNPAQEITGVLVRGGGVFMQVLEGPEQAVLRLYVKVLDDPRHSDCRIIHISPVNQRLFQQWSMGSIDCDPLEFQHVMELRAHRLESVHEKEFAEVMQDFRRKLNAGQKSGA